MILDVELPLPYLSDALAKRYSNLARRVVLCKPFILVNGTIFSDML
ncbi:MAG: hypothetical protein JW908_12570 [Anaerolineales bacterium]|nr:hypothetical protein [Anaerolineales bacterium]